MRNEIETFGFLPAGKAFYFLLQERSVHTTTETKGNQNIYTCGGGFVLWVYYHTFAGGAAGCRMWSLTIIRSLS